ncbi:MAG: glycosyltransferase [Bacteroidia bacterium]|nr:glycosyltransferase [Bacteroidia bacterium]
MPNIITILYLVCGFSICLYFLIQLISVYGLFKMKKAESNQIESKPDSYKNISILVAARNERANIIRCLESINLMDYPKDKLEVLIGNDQSQDNTGELVADYIKDKPVFRLINLTGNEFPQTKGKARVLAVLAKESLGDILLITDADIELQPLWAKSLCEKINNGYDLATGTTWIKSTNSFEHYQAVDWMYFMGLSNSFAFLGLPLTAVGNNMAISRKSYLETGGYENIKFSIVEDYALFKEVRKKGAKTINMMTPETLLLSQPITDFKKLMSQRKRWLGGLWSLPFHWQMILSAFGAYYLSSLVLLFLNPLLFLIVIVVKNIIQMLQINLIHKILKKPLQLLKYCITYDLYLYIVTPLVSLYYVIPFKTDWKGRKY